jgi:hypothetical protein
MAESVVTGARRRNHLAYKVVDLGVCRACQFLRNAGPNSAVTFDGDKEMAFIG